MNSRIRNRLSKKSQSEIAGLLVIVVLISFIMLFVLFMMMQPPQTSEGEKINRASSYVGSMLKTSAIGCLSSEDLQYVLIECIKSGGSKGRQCTENKTRYYCEYVESVIDETLSKTLKEWNDVYEFKVTDTFGNEVVHINSSNLSRVDSGSTFIQPIPVDYGEYENIFVTLCMGRCAPS